MMILYRHLIGFFAALLFSTMSVAALPLAPNATNQTKFFPHLEAANAEHTNVHFTARALSTTVTDIAFTGAAVAEQGNGIVMRGHETHVASLGFGVGLDATKGGVNADDVSFGRNPNQEHHTWRHVDDLGLERNTVQNEILSNFPTNPIQGPNTMQVTVNGRKLQVNFYQFPDGTFNVGRINELP